MVTHHIEFVAVQRHVLQVESEAACDQAECVRLALEVVGHGEVVGLKVHGEDEPLVFVSHYDETEALLPVTGVEFEASAAWLRELAVLLVSRADEMEEM